MKTDYLYFHRDFHRGIIRGGIENLKSCEVLLSELVVFDPALAWPLSDHTVYRDLVSESQLYV